MEPPSTGSGRIRRRGTLAVVAAAFLACLATPAPAGQAPPQAPPSNPQPATNPAGKPPAVGDPAPDIPLFDPKNNESSLREILKEKIVVLVFYIGYT